MGTVNSLRHIGLACVGLFAAAALAVALIPSAYWSGEWVRYREYSGTFAGRPVIMNPPSIQRATVPLEYRIHMAGGVCRIARVDHEGTVIPHTEMGSGYVLRDEISTNEQLRLDPGMNVGRYSVGMGLKYHVLSPFLWRWLAIGALIGLSAVGLLSLILHGYTTARLPAMCSYFTPFQWATLATLYVLSAAIFYPALHESGHALFGVLLGGRVDEIVLTPIAGETPHVTFDDLPKESGPWMNAGGVILPIAFAYLLLVIWFGIQRRLSVYGQALLLIPSVVLLLPGFGVDDHLRGIALQLGCTSQWSVFLVKSMPAWLATVTFAMLISWFWLRKAQS